MLLNETELRMAFILAIIFAIIAIVMMVIAILLLWRALTEEGNEELTLRFSDEGEMRRCVEILRENGIQVLQ